MSKIQITTWWTLMKVSGKMWLIVILKVTKKQCFFNPRKSIFWKTTEGGQIDPHPPLAFLGSKRTECFNTFRHKSTTCWSSFLTQIYEIFVNLIMLWLLQWLFFFFCFLLEAFYIFFLLHSDWRTTVKIGFRAWNYSSILCYSYPTVFFSLILLLKSTCFFKFLVLVFCTYLDILFYGEKISLLLTLESIGN